MGPEKCVLDVFFWGAVDDDMMMIFFFEITKF